MIKNIKRKLETKSFEAWKKQNKRYLEKEFCADFINMIIRDHYDEFDEFCQIEWKQINQRHSNFIKQIERRENGY